MVNTKNKIINIAEKLFANQGFDQTSVREISEEVGVSKANLYHHFSSKKALLKTIIEKAFNDYKSEINTIATENKESENKIRSAIISYLDMCASNKNLVQLLAREDIKRNENVRGLIMNIEQKVRTLWKELLQEINFKGGYSVDVFVELFMTMIDSFVIKNYVMGCEQMNISHEELADHILYLFFDDNK